MGIYISFGSYDPADDDNDAPGQGGMRDFLHDPTPEEDLEQWLQEETQDDGPVVAAQGLCTECGRTALTFMPLFRWSSKHRKRFPVWTVDGADCGNCDGAGTVRQALALREKPE